MPEIEIERNFETIQAERRIVGGILSGAVGAASINLLPDDFSDLRSAFTVCRSHPGMRLTPEVLYHNLIEKFPDDAFYSAADFRAMAESTQSASLVFEAVDKLKAASLKTFLRSRIAAILSEKERSGASILDELKAVIEIADKNYSSVDNNFVLVKEIIPRLEAVYRDMHSNISHSISTGFKSIDDEILDGFSRGDLHIIVGLTGHGKSALALNCAVNQAMAGHFVGFLSREMSDVENVMRIQASRQKIPRWQMRSGVYDTTYQELCAGLDDLRGLSIAFDTRTTTIENLAVAAKRLVEQKEMRILYVDYLQLLGSNVRKYSRAEDVAAISRGLKLIAMENQIPVVALSQFNRGAMTADVGDLLGHIKESSGVEQDASSVTYLQIDNSMQDARIKKAKIQILKNRNGATFRPVFMDYCGEIFTFSEPERMEF